MSMNWPLAVVIIALLFLGYCAYSVRGARRRLTLETPGGGGWGADHT
ncbi:MAG: hypothetical protein HYS09_00680 [Chloroflexi bacterium]|nr:hypothetical protein [Chloroflexota bacterium]